VPERYNRLSLNRSKAVLTHLDSQGRANMVDVTDKAVTSREAVAQARIRMLPQTLRMIVDGEHPKGDVFAVARIAGIQAAKKTSDLIPLCHPLMLTSVKVELRAEGAGSGNRFSARHRGGKDGAVAGRDHR